MWRTRSGLPLADAEALRAPARRTRLVRAFVGLLLAGIVAAALWAAPRAGSSPRDDAAARASTVVVLDLSASVDTARLAIGRALVRIIREVGARGRVGLVIFSDSAEEALPVGTAVRELAAFVHYFRPPHRGAPGVAATNPWAPRFSFGTTISSGLRAARRMVEREGRVSRVVLV